MHAEKQIHDQQSGAVALLLHIIHQAAEDVRLAMESPETKDLCGPQSRHALGREAARWLSGPECRYLVQCLAGCGVHVPMRRIHSNLSRLKR